MMRLLVHIYKGAPGAEKGKETVIIHAEMVLYFNTVPFIPLYALKGLENKKLYLVKRPKCLRHLQLQTKYLSVTATAGI